LQPVAAAAAAAALLEVADKNKGTYNHNYQSAMSLLVIDFTCLDGRDGELLVKELTAVDSHSNAVSSYVFQRLYGWEEAPMFNARINQAIDGRRNWNDGDIPYSELETVLHRDVSSAVAIYCFGPQKMTFICSLIDRIFIHITQLGCPQHPDMCLPTISCTFACHNKSKHVCAFRSVYSLAQWLNLQTLSLLYAKCHLSLHICNVFQMWALLRRTHFVNEQ
jgi:hypothetical protein